MSQQISIIEPTKDGKYIDIRVPCPHCGRIYKATRIKSDEKYEMHNVRCECKITGFDWSYTPNKVDSKYIYITSSASISVADTAKVEVWRSKNVKLSNR